MREGEGKETVGGEKTGGGAGRDPDEWAKVQREGKKPEEAVQDGDTNRRDRDLERTETQGEGDRGPERSK